MQVNKLVFSPEELAVLGDSRFFELKHRATQGLYALFGELEEKIRSSPGLRDLPFQDLAAQPGRIRKGENYRLLPYVVLDFPGYFSKESVFAFRSMFWWGHGFSFSLHLQGAALEQFRPHISGRISELLQKDFLFCTNSTPWEYHYEAKNYMPLDDVLKKERIEWKQLEFLKLSRRLNLEQYDQMVKYGAETWSYFEKMLNGK